MKHHLSRRTFVAGSIAVGMSNLIFSLSGCSSKDEGTLTETTPKTELLSWTAGTYAAEVNGHNAPFTAEVTFSETAITSIDTSSNLETIGVGKYALDKLAKEITEYQSLNCDTITGATISSMSILSAVEQCAKEAGATTALNKAEGSEASINDEYTSDVCVIGGGGAGLAAAISAAQSGASVVILEKCGISGGSTNVSEGALNAVDPERQEKQGIEDSIELFYTATMEGGHEEGTPDLVHYLTDNALDSVYWLESLGVKFKDEVGAATGSLGQRSHYPATPSGNTYTRSFIDFIDAHTDKITLLHDMQVTSLIMNGDDVAGAVAIFKGDKEVAVSAKSTIIATGGFGANVEYRQQVNDGVWSSVKLDNSIGCTNINPCAQGEGLALAEDAGAELIGLSDIQLHPCGTPGTGLMEDIRTSGFNRVFVNKDGDRFVNEGAARDTLCEAIFAQPESTYWIVVNSARYPSPTEPDSNGSTIENMIARGHVVAGDTIEELAAATGMVVTKLQNSIDTYNGVIAGTGVDPYGFTPKGESDVQITEGPWYACKKVPTVHHTMGGIRIDAAACALNASGDPVGGLYAAGEVTGGIHGSNRLGGNAIADIMTFGRLAGKSAAASALT